MVVVSSDSETSHFRAPRTSSHLARRLQDEATEDLTWLWTESNLTTGTTSYKDSNYHVAMPKDGLTVGQHDNEIIPGQHSRLTLLYFLD
jgi:hypothetical protein